MVILSGFFAGLLLISGSSNSAFARDVTFYGEITTADVINGSSKIDTSPMTPFNAPKLDAINGSDWDEWYFDGVSKDGSTGLSILFARDATLTRWNFPILRVSIDCVWSNGTRFTTMMFANTSSVYERDGVIIGKWIGSDWHASFRATTDNREIDIGFDGPQIQGRYHVRSFTKAHYANEYIFPDKRGIVAFAPMIYWNEAVPAGNLEAKFSLEGTPLQLSGYGGTDHNWGPYAYDYFAAHWRWMRAILGPYTMIFWIHTSALDNNTYTSAFLFDGGEVLFDSTASDRVTLDLRYDGEVHGQFRDLSTGFDVAFKGDNDKTWSFRIDHQRVVFESDRFSANNEYSRFTNTVSGGLVGGDTFEGVAVNEQGFIIDHWQIPA